MRKACSLVALLVTAALTALFGVAPLALAATTSAPTPDLFGTIAATLWPIALAAAPVAVPIVNGPIVAWLTQQAKGLPIPFEGNTRTGLIVALGAFSTLTTLVCNFLVAWLSGNVASFDFANAITIAGQVVTSILTAAGAFGLWKKQAAG